MFRKIVLAFALISTLGLGFGWMSEDLCTLAGSNADAPGAPVAAVEYALPRYVQPAPKAALPQSAGVSTLDDSIRVGSSATVPQGHSSNLSVLQNPQRC